MGGRRWHLREGGQRRPGRPPRQALLQGMGFRTRARRTGTGRTAPASTRRSCRRRCGTPRRSARSAAGRRAPAGRRPNAPSAGGRKEGAWQDPEGRLGVGPAGGEISQDFLVAVVVTGDRAVPGNVPGNVFRQQGAQGRDVVPAGVEGCLGLVEGLEQPHVGVRTALPGPARLVTNHRGEASAARTAGYPVLGPRPRRGSA